MATLRRGQESLPLDLDNEFLAHLQVAMHKRFVRGGCGFFLTGTYRNSDKTEVTASYWMHPSMPWELVYDVRDDGDNRMPPVRLDDAKIDAMLEAMDRPVGVRAGSDVWLSFAELP